MDKNLICDFCDKKFVREANFVKHKCEKMKRHELFKKPIGHLAYLIFNQWRKICGYPSVTVDTFTASKYFNAFIKFAEYSNSMAIPDKIGYIELMVKKTLMPFDWCDNDVYDYYITNFDKEYSIDQKVDLSIETMVDISEKNDCEVSEIFKHVTPIQVIKYVTSRKLSPWLLLPSKKFMDFMTYNTTAEERLLFTSFINVGEWKKYFIANPEKVTEIKNINRQLGI